MKGVVRPQERPTRRKPRVQARMEGEGGGDATVTASGGVIMGLVELTEGFEMDWVDKVVLFWCLQG